jgi:5-formyltetrahydrofolate cyclo-ligase
MRDAGWVSSATKAELRARIRAARAARSPGERAALANQLCSVLLDTTAVGTAGTVAAYVAVGTEPGTGPLLESLRDRGTRVLLPLLEPDGDLDWADYTGVDGLVTAAHMLQEPTGPRLGRDAAAAADVIVVPALAVDRAGHRLGRGGGAYDRVLSRLGGAVFSIALVHDGEVVDVLPVDSWDIPVSAAATPTGVAIRAR